MSKQLYQKKTKTGWLWIAVIMALGLAAAMIFYDPVGGADDNVVAADSDATSEERLATDLELNEPVQSEDGPPSEAD